MYGCTSCVSVPLTYILHLATKAICASTSLAFPLMSAMIPGSQFSSQTEMLNPISSREVIGSPPSFPILGFRGLHSLVTPGLSKDIWCHV